MPRKFISLLILINMIILFFNPNVSAVGEFTIDIYDQEKQVIFSDNQTSQTISMDGVVNYNGVSSSGDTIHLSSTSDFGEPNISPDVVTFYETGSQEFTVELTIQNIYTNGRTGNLKVEGSLNKGLVIITSSDEASIAIYNYSNLSNDNLNNTTNHQTNNMSPGIEYLLLLSIIIIVIMITIVIIKKRKSN